MERIKLGRTGMEITRAGFGGIPIQRVDDETATRVIRRAIDLGMDWFDTAFGYGNSEERIGRAIKGYDRDKLKIFTKTPAKNPADLRKHLETSLKRLGVDAVDLYQFHNVGSADAWQAMIANGTLDAALEARRRGQVRHVAASAHTREAALAVIAHPDIEVLQFPFNFLVAAEEMPILERCRELGKGFIAMKPFAGGVLEEAAPCVRFLLQLPGLVLDPGFERESEVEEVVALCDANAPLTTADKARIAKLQGELSKKFCHRCGYCMPCEQGVEIVTLMNMASFLKRFPPDKVLGGFTAAAVASHDNCTDCGECEGKCPYKLTIREQMKVSVRMFEEDKKKHAA
jgi:uncharacterized protein